MSESENLQKKILESLEQINAGIQKIVDMQERKIALIRDYQQASRKLQELKDGRRNV